MFLLIPMMLITAGDVIGRRFWAKSIPGTVELSSYMLAVFILLGVAYTHQVKGHVKVSMLVSRLPDWAGNIADIITTLLSLVIIAILAWQGLVVGIEERTVSDMLRIPQLPFRLLVSVAGLFLWLELFMDLAESVGRLVRR
jgi:TRAP-type C4-dicarboxylate transport system permease small subunit